jgi:DNA replication protein DnaC
MSFDDLSEEALRAKILRDAATARKRHTRGKVEKPAPVTPEEFNKRLDQSLRKDATLMRVVKDDRINKEKQLWAKRVNNTFMNATSERPVILDRVRRMQTHQGLHKTSLIFAGEKYGRGKTWEAYSYLNSLVNTGAVTAGQVAFGTEAATISRICNSGYERDDRMHEWLRESNKVFFIDDVGQGYYFKDKSRLDAWFQFIDHVYTNQLSLVMTTNLTFAESGQNSLGSWIGPAAFDRVKSLCGNDGYVLMNGANRRGEVLEQNEQSYRETQTKSRTYGR